MSTPNYPPHGASDPYGGPRRQGGPPGSQQEGQPGGQPPPIQWPSEHPRETSQGTPQGGQTYGDQRPSGDERPYGDRQPYGDPQSYGDRQSYRDQQPYGRDPYGDQQPPPPPLGQPPLAPEEPAAKRRGTRTALIVVGAIVALALAVGGYLYFMADSSTEAAAGDCIKVNKATRTDADIEKVGCDSAEAMYKVGVAKEDSAAKCPRDTYVTYTEEGKLLLCLQLNVKEGDCVHETDTADERVACGSQNETYKVLKVIKGQDDVNACGGTGAQDALTYPEPALTICRSMTNTT